MIQQLFKVILGGILAGIVLFLLPFLLIKLLIIFLLMGMIFRLFGWRRHRWHHHHHRSFYGMDPQKKYAYAQRWRNMSEEERKQFVQKMETELFSSHTNTSTNTGI